MHSIYTSSYAKLDQKCKSRSEGNREQAVDENHCTFTGRMSNPNHDVPHRIMVHYDSASTTVI